MVTYSSILAWKIPWTEEPGVLQSMGLERVGHDQETNTHTHTHPLTSGLRNLKNTGVKMHLMFGVQKFQLEQNS